MKKLLFVCGSLREASASAAMIRALILAMDGHADCTVADIATLPHYNADLQEPAGVAAFKAAVDEADAVVLVTPEYNYSIPGVLKNAIDWASRPAYQSVFKGKDCLVISLSGGALGGARAQGHLKYILNGMLAKVFPWQEIVVTHANAKVDNGLINDQVTMDFATTALRSLIAAPAVSRAPHPEEDRHVGGPGRTLRCFHRDQGGR